MSRAAARGGRDPPPRSEVTDWNTFPESDFATVVWSMLAFMEGFVDVGRETKPKTGTSKTYEVGFEFK